MIDSYIFFSPYFFYFKTILIFNYSLTTDHIYLILGSSEDWCLKQSIGVYFTGNSTIMDKMPGDLGGILIQN